MKEKERDRDPERAKEKDLASRQQIKKLTTLPKIVEKRTANESVTSERATITVDVVKIRSSNLREATKPVAAPGKGNKRIRLVGRLEDVGVNVASDSTYLYIFNQFRAQEVVLFKKLRETYVLPRERLEGPIFLNPA